MMKKTSKLTLALSTFALLITAGVASARGQGPGAGPGGPLCDGMGPDGAGPGPGGFGPPAEVMKQFDKNGDGKLDDTERQAAHAAMKTRREEAHKQMLAKYDANRDGKLDDAEHAKLFDDKAAEHFQAIDTNRDGKISLDEFKAGVRNHHAGFGPPHGRGGRGMMPRGGQGPR